MRYTAASLSKKKTKQKKKKTDTQTNNNNKKHMRGRRRIHGIQYVCYNTYLQLTSVYWLIKGSQQGFPLVFIDFKRVISFSYKLL